VRDSFDTRPKRFIFMVSEVYLSLLYLGISFLVFGSREAHVR
jgi:hypothetical protein